MIKKGRPPKINVELLRSCFKKYKNDIMFNNKICPKNSQIWSTIAKEMNNKITPYSLYTYACNNIYDLKNIVLKEQTFVSNSSESSLNNSLEPSKSLSESFVTDDKTDTFEISVSKQEFDSIIEERLQKRTGRNLNKKASYKRTLRFKSGLYQKFFAKLFWKTRRLQSCVINYINHYIPQNINGGYLNGYCRCGSSLYVKFELRDCDNNVILLCSFKEGEKIKKCGPLYLRGETRKMMVKELEKTMMKITLSQYETESIRVDTYLQRHIEHLFSEMFLDDANSGENQYKLNKISSRDISNKSCIKKEQLPLDLGYKKNRISPKLQSTQPEVSIFKHCSNVLTAHKIDGILYSLLNSCPFDSLVQTLFVIGTDNANIKKMITTIEENQFYDLIKYLFKHGITNEAYKRRTELMAIHGNVAAYNKRLKKKTIDCENNVGEMFLKLTGNSFYSLKYIDYCENQCKEVTRHQSKMLFIKETQLRKEIIDVSEIEEVFPLKLKCNTCQETEIRKFWKINVLVIIELLTPEEYKIKEIPKYIINKEKNEKRELCAIIRYIGTVGRGIGHYTAICQRPNGSWEEFDGLKKEQNITKITQEHEIIPTMLFYKL